MRINTGCFLNGCKCFNPDDEDGVGVRADREWVGLTDEEIRESLRWSYGNFARAIEAKLKEKNNANR
jgi:hypothetical protein